MGKKVRLSEQRLDHPHWLKDAREVSQQMEGYMRSVDLLKLIQQVLKCGPCTARNVLAAGDGRYFLWFGDKWFGFKPGGKMSDEKKTEWKKPLKETPAKGPDATSPTEALNDAMKGIDLGNKKDEKSGQEKK